MTPDNELLRQYAENGSEAAFTELVRRYVGLAYSAALRQVGDEPALAEDAVQSVFISLARKAGSLTSHTTLAGWIHTSVRFVALRARRDQRLRQAREQEAFSMQNDSMTCQVRWEELRPTLDEAIADLGERDREAVLLRYFQGWSHREVAAALQLNEDAARMRVDRALDKLHEFFAKRGVKTTATLLATHLGAHAATPAPTAFAATLPGTSLAGAAATGTKKIVLFLAAAAVALVAVPFLISRPSAVESSPASVSASPTSAATSASGRAIAIARPPPGMAAAVPADSPTTPVATATPNAPAPSSANATLIAQSSPVVTPAVRNPGLPIGPATMEEALARNTGALFASAPLTPDDSASRRFNAMVETLQLALRHLQNARSDIHGGFVEKATADVQQALTDTRAGLAYLQAHPGEEPPSTWDMGGRMPDPFPALPRYTGYMMNGQGGLRLNDRSGGAASRATAAGSTTPKEKIDENLLLAFATLRLAGTHFMTGPSVKPYQIGPVGGFREAVRVDLNHAGRDIIAAMEYATTPRASADGELLVNGGFEAVVVQLDRRGGSGAEMQERADKLGWHMVSSSPFIPGGGPRVLRRGFATNPTQTEPRTLTAPAFEGEQWLNLAHGGSGATNGGASYQMLSTIPGRQYTLTFAYASSPYPPTRGEPYPNSATITIQETATGKDLVKPFSFVHKGSTKEDYHWVRHDPVTFTAESENTMLRFTADHISGGGLDGVFLDAVSVKPVAPPPAEAAPAPIPGAAKAE